jgi:hypothetical protein
MGDAREHEFTFRDEIRAVLFVRRLRLWNLRNLVIFRNEKSVRVVDNGDANQGEAIRMLAKMSGFVPAVDSGDD